MSIDVAIMVDELTKAKMWIMKVLDDSLHFRAALVRQGPLSLSNRSLTSHCLYHAATYGRSIMHRSMRALIPLSR